MKRLDRLIEEKGMTLYELLAVIVISGILLSSIYGVFLTGVNLYKKIGIESQLKEEADYILATVLNEFYAFSPDDVEYHEETNELSLSLFNQLNINEKDYITSSLEKEALTRKATIELQEGSLSSGKDIFLVVEELAEGAEPDLVSKRIQINDANYSLLPALNMAGDELPIVDFSCISKTKSFCTGGTVSIQFQLAHKQYSQEGHRLFVAPIEYYSKFGF